VKNSRAGLGEAQINPRLPGESRDLSLHWRFAASNRNTVPTEGEFVQPNDGPQLAPGKRIDDWRRKFFHKLSGAISMFSLFFHGIISEGDCVFGGNPGPPSVQPMTDQRELSLFHRCFPLLLCERKPSQVALRSELRARRDM
jgi:hypothetical protein